MPPRKIIVGDRVLGGIPKDESIPNPPPIELHEAMTVFNADPPHPLTAVCPICSVGFPGINRLMTHLRDFHLTDDGFMEISAPTLLHSAAVLSSTGTSGLPIGGFAELPMSAAAFSSQQPSRTNSIRAMFQSLRQFMADEPGPIQ